MTNLYSQRQERDIECEREKVRLLEKQVELAERLRALQNEN